MLYNLGMLTEEFLQTLESFRELEARIAGVKNYRSKKDLLQMARTCENLVTDLSKEAVTCRRLKRLTPEFNSISERFIEAVRNLEELATFALLLDS